MVITIKVNRILIRYFDISMKTSNNKMGKNIGSYQ